MPTDSERSDKEVAIAQAASPARRHTPQEYLNRKSVMDTLRIINDSDPRLVNAIKMSACANLGPEVGTQDLNPRMTSACLERIRTTSRNGWLGDVALNLLTIQQQPFVRNPDGSDSASNKILAVMDGIEDLSPTEAKANVSYICTNNSPSNCMKAPLSSNEATEAMIGFSRGANWNLDSNRAIPVDKATAAVIGYADAQMNMDRWLDEGKTLQQTAARILSENTKAGLEAGFRLCTALNNIPDNKQECAHIGGRLSLLDALDSGVRYRGTERTQPRAPRR